VVSGFRAVVAMKDVIERTLIYAYVSLLFTRGLFNIVTTNIDILVKTTAISVFGFLIVLSWWEILSMVKSIITRTPPKDAEPLWLSKLKGAKRLAVLTLLATSGVAATYIFIRVIQQVADSFEIILYAYTAFTIWFIFVLEVASAKVTSRPSSQNNAPTSRS